MLHDETSIPLIQKLDKDCKTITDQTFLWNADTNLKTTLTKQTK